MTIVDGQSPQSPVVPAPALELKNVSRGLRPHRRAA